MSTSILIYGESGTGKSTSLRNMNAQDTFIIAAMSKPLPFRGWKTKYIPVTLQENGYNYTEGNYLINDSCNIIIAAMNAISEQRPDIKNIIIDDFQYIMSNQYMRRATEKGWEKFTDIGESTWRVLERSPKLRSDLKVFFLAHSETQEGKTKLKTIGKMLDEKVCLEGMFTIVLNSILLESQYVFVTQNNGNSIAKSPIGMFKQLAIPNDLCAVIKAIDEYESEDEKDSLIAFYAQLDKSTTSDELKKSIVDICKTARAQGFTQSFIDLLKQYAIKLNENFKPKEESKHE